ncbi:hypothetical protein DAI22_11g242200 [Oryza sativa Japonica Group]|nr:hypothetical protein DAI22_11g242200 [Oryza sativa Japonica Group]KAF2912254.1 hypothetical protein DAI22_11g242200 [Oryza sativa Japonica Group]
MPYADMRIIHTRYICLSIHLPANMYKSCSGYCYCKCFQQPAGKARLLPFRQIQYRHRHVMHTQLSISIGDSSEELSELIQCISCLVISSPHHKQQQLPGKNKQQQQLVIDEEENRGWLDFSISLLIAAYICLTNRPSKPAMWPTRLAGPTCQRDTVQQGITLH